MENINRFIQTLPNLEEFTLHLAVDHGCLLEHMSFPPCILKPLLSQPKGRELFLANELGSGSNDQTENSQSEKMFWIDSLTFSINESVILDSFWAKELALARNLIITRPPFSQPIRIPGRRNNRLLTPDYWPTFLESFDTGDRGFSLDFLHSNTDTPNEGVPNVTPFVHLTNIRCLPHVLTHLLSNTLTPSLQIVTLTGFIQGEPSIHDEFEELVALILSSTDFISSMTSDSSSIRIGRGFLSSLIAYYGTHAAASCSQLGFPHGLTTTFSSLWYLLSEVSHKTAH